MPQSRHTSRLFSLPEGIESAGPDVIEPSTFTGLKALEVQHIERWIQHEPLVLGEELLIVASQLQGFDKTKDRPDLLAVDRQGKLCVVEIKRDESGSSQDLQALRYAAYVSTIDVDRVVALYREHRVKAHAEDLTDAAARSALDTFCEFGDLDDLDDDDRPRVLLVAGGFQIGVTATALWLTRTYGLDITCVVLTPYTVGDHVVLSSSVLIPLPEAAAFEVKLQEKKRRATQKKAGAGQTIDFVAAVAFVASVPEGRWTTYGEVALAAGAPKGAQAIGMWLSRETDAAPNVWRVLNAKGEVSEGWKGTSANVPATPHAARERLAQEGVVFAADGRADKTQRWVASDAADEQ